LTRKQVLLDSGGGNLLREDKEKPKSIPGKKTQSRKVSYTKTRPEIYCNCKCDLYAKKLAMVKRSATPACCTSCIQRPEGQSIQINTAIFKEKGCSNRFYMASYAKNNFFSMCRNKLCQVVTGKLFSDLCNKQGSHL